MKTSDLELPLHLYTETRDQDGVETGGTFAADKLVAWSEDGYGDAIDKWCNQICRRELDVIETWEDDRILQLEDDWVSVENDGDEDEQRYHLACEAITREAGTKRDNARDRMAEHKTAIEELVQESRNWIEAHKPPPQEDNYVGYLVAIAAIAAGAYVLVT